MDRERLREFLKKHEWAGTAHGMYGGIARTCIECLEIHPDEALYHGNGQYEHGKGHKPDCRLKRFLECKDD